MDVREAAGYLHLTPKKVYALAAEGLLPATKITGKWLFPRALVDQWLLESSHGGVLADRLVVAGGDDPLLADALERLAAEHGAGALIALAPVTTRQAIELLAARRAELAALHWGPGAESALRHPALLARHRGHRDWVLVRACEREHGLVVHPELGGESSAALCTGPRRWALRPEGSGALRFLRETLAGLGVDRERLTVAAVAPSARAAAALVASGAAEVAPGTRALAAEHALAFVPGGWEALDLAVPRAVYFRRLFRRLLEALRDPPATALAERLGGYRLERSGEIVWSAE